MDTPAEFLEAYEAPFYLGIDPGATGGLGLLSSCGQGLVLDIPVETIKRKGGTTSIADHPKIIELFDEFESILYPASMLICLEIAQVQVHGKGNNAYTGFRVAQHYAMWPLFLKDRGYPLIEVNPQSWKPEMGFTGWDKEQMRLHALSLFPHVEGLERKSDHNRAEALLLALYRKQNKDEPIRNSRSRTRRKS